MRHDIIYTMTGKDFYLNNTYISIIILLSVVTMSVKAQESDSTVHRKPFVHRIEADVVPSTILHTNKYLNGSNQEGRTMNHAFTARLKYAFQLPSDDERSAIYRGAYQGVGVAYHEFNPQLSNPVSAFIFQGARIKSFSPHLSLNYEWNLGLTFGWNPYNNITNPENCVIGSKITAYIDTDIYLRWRINRYLDANIGVSFAHFSNGNTTLPNRGLNVLGMRTSLAYYIGRSREYEAEIQRTLPSVKHRMKYDIVFFGAWRQIGYDTAEGTILVPGKYSVWGFNFNPMYTVNYWLNVGASVDGVYDRGANLYINSDAVRQGERGYEYADVTSPSASRQMALGLSGRVEFVMPFFTINMGIGHYVVGATDSLNIWYQILALKLNITRHFFLHIGYSLQDFQHPNHLMLGCGVRL